MSHLCTMHRPPLSKERTGGDYIWGEEFMQGGEDTHLAPSKHRQHLSLSLHPCDGGGGGHLLRREHLPLHSPVSHEEGGVQHLSLLRFMLERHTTRRRRVLRSGDLFSGQSGHTGTVSSVEDRIRDQKTVLCCISGLLYSPS